MSLTARPAVCWIVVVGGLVLTTPSAEAVECFTPKAWQPRLTNTPRDLNHDYVEDSLEGQSGPLGVILALNDCPDTADIQRFARFGTVELVGKFLSFVVLQNVKADDVPALAADPLVAFVEEDSEVFPMLDTSRSTIGADKVTSTYGFDGKGVNIAIVDSGVDDGVHNALPAEIYVGGYDAVAKAFVNPDDEDGHGTFVASVALGHPVAKNTVCDGVSSGIAPGAGLIDIRVLKKKSTQRSTILRGLEVALDKRIEWSIRVLNLSLGECKASNGTDILSQCVNRMVADGIVVVLAAGNSSDCKGVKEGSKLVAAPGAADDGISVANSTDRETADRSDDEIAPTSLRGPRTSDNDADAEDEQKPDIAAPGTDITAAFFDSACDTARGNGTSFAAPHVAGCAALLIQAKPDISPQALKRLLLDTAEGRPEPGWNPAWGHGLLDCFAAADRLVKSSRSDLKFDVYVNRPDIEWWFSPDVFSKEPLVEKQPNVIHAVVANGGPAAAVGAVVRLAVYNFSNGDLEYSICTVPLPETFAAGDKADVSCAYTPVISGKPPGTVHACLKAEIVYPFDNDFTNNRAQHNVDIRQAKSPATFNVRVINPTQLDLVMHLRERFMSGSGWELVKGADGFLLRADDCPRTVTLQLVPRGPAVSPSAKVSVAVVGKTASGHEIALGGVVLVSERTCSPVVISPTTLQNGIVGTLYNQAITSTGGTAPHTFVVSSGSLPPGITLSSLGALSGSPTMPGTYCFSVAIADSAGCSARPQDYTTVISTATCTPGTAITLFPATLPSARTGVPYSQTILASGGTPPYTFSVTSGTLPPGLTLSSAGMLSGTPTVSGVFTFTIAVTDINGCQGSMGCQIVMHVDIPTLSGWTMVLFFLVLAATAIAAIRKIGA